MRVEVAEDTAKLRDLDIGDYATNKRQTILFRVTGPARDPERYLVRVLGRLTHSDDGYQLGNGVARDSEKALWKKTTVYPVNVIE